MVVTWWIVAFLLSASTNVTQLAWLSGWIKNCRVPLTLQLDLSKFVWTSFKLWFVWTKSQPNLTVNQYAYPVYILAILMKETSRQLWTGNISGLLLLLVMLQLIIQVPFPTNHWMHILSVWGLDFLEKYTQLKSKNIHLNYFLQRDVFIM